MIGHLLARQVDNLKGLFFNPGSSFSLGSLFAAACIAMAFVLFRPRRAGREVPARLLVRALFPKRLLTSASSRADLLLMAMNTSLVVAVFAGAILSSEAVARVVRAGWSEAALPTGVLPLAGAGARVLMTLVLFLAYELAYWSNHYASHRLPLLWAFHKVHHTAEVLSPVTVYRVHPVDSIVFANFLAVFTGVAAGVFSSLLGRDVATFAVGRTNVVLLAFTFTVVHLQHSEFWIAAGGRLGRVIMSPAHHQIHHSDDPAHHNTNFGSCLALWDWMFGTLVAPQPAKPRLTFGAGPRLAGNHTALGLLVAPFAEAWKAMANPAAEAIGAVGAAAWPRRAKRAPADEAA